MSYGIRQFYRAPARHLKDSIGPESVFEKPYLTKEYVDLQQSPNVPEIPPSPGGVGGLECLYNPNECEITIGCYAGPEIKITGGPEELSAGYSDPEVLIGDVINWTVQSDPRELSFVVNPEVAQNVVQVGFVDGWGEEHAVIVDISCVPPEYYWCWDSDTLSSPVNSTFDYQVLFTGETLNYYRSYIILDPANIPAGATITKAVLSVVANGSSSSPMRVRIYLHAINDATSFPGSANEFLTFLTSLTTNSVVWEPSIPWVSSTRYEAPDISTLLTEVIDRAGWNSGQAIGVFILPETEIGDIPYSSYNGRRWVYCNGPATNLYPELECEWTSPVGNGTWVASGLTNWERVYKKCNPTVFRPRVTTDCGLYQDTGISRSYYNFGASGQLLGYDGTIQSRCTRFPDVPLAQGATPKVILSVYNLYQYNVIIELKVYGLDEDNGNCPINLAEWDTDIASNLTTASIDWDLTANVPAADMWLDLDVSSIVQEIVGRGGWSSGNAIVIFILNDQTAVSPAYRVVNNYHFILTNPEAPKLTIS